MIVFGLLLACGDGKDPDESKTSETSVDTGTNSDTTDSQTDDNTETATEDTSETVQEEDTGICADAPVVTYASFGEGFMTFYCQGCHASTAMNRYGAPENIVFDTHADVIALSNRIYDRVLDEDLPMPPAGGILPDDHEKLKIWIECWDAQ